MTLFEYWSQYASIHDEFAIPALTGLLASEGDGFYKPERAAERAYDIAEAMVAERAKRTAATEE